MNIRRRVQRLLEELFNPQEFIDEILFQYPWEQDALRHIQPRSSVATFFSEIVSAADRRKELDARFFELLRGARPRCHSAIDEVERAWRAQLPHTTALPPAPPPSQEVGCASIEGGPSLAAGQQSPDQSEEDHASSGFHVLDDWEIEWYHDYLWHSRAFRNLSHRLEKLKVDVTWAVQKDYSEWRSEGSLEDLPSESSSLFRLLIFEILDAEEGEEGSWELLAALTIQPHEQGHRHHVPPRLVTVLISDPPRLLSEDVYLLSVHHRIFLPWLSPDPIGVFSFPFREQDGSRNRCIDVCLWMCFAYLRRHLQSRTVYLEEITRIRGHRHLLPAPGLEPAQIRELIRRAGFTPLEYLSDRGGSSSATDKALGLRRAAAGGVQVHRPAFVEILHAYLDSQLPVVLIINRHPREHTESGETRSVDKRRPPWLHSLVVVGHTQPEHAAHPPSQPDAQYLEMFEALGFKTTTPHIQDVIVQDDDIGPYLRLSLCGDGVCEIPNPQRLYNESVWDSATEMFVALPASVRVPVEQILIHIKNLLHKPLWKQQYTKHLSTLEPEGVLTAEISALAEQYMIARDNHELVLSVYLDTSSRLKSNVAADRELAEPDQLAILNARMPRYVYVVEISSSDLLRADAPRVLGEAIFDSTIESSRAGALIMARLPGMLSINRAQPVHLVSETLLRHQWLRRNF